MKFAKVLTTCFKRGRVRKKTELLGDPPGYFSHSQNFTTIEETINLIKYQIKMEKKYPPGMNRDLIIVNSDVGSEQGNKFIQELNNKEINDGKILTFTRKNIGLSYGAYSDAFLKFREFYDFFLFIEDDLITAKQDYLRIGFEKWNQTEACGFVAFYGLSKVKKGWWKKAGLNKNNAITAYGGCGLSSTKVLNQIVNEIGKLPHNVKGIDHTDSIAYGELGISKYIIDLGYKLTEIKKEVLVMPAYDLMRNVKYKKYPSFFVKYSWVIKSIIYDKLSKFPKLLNFYLMIIQKIKSIIQ